MSLGAPSVNTLINSSNCTVLGNTASGTALTVQQLGTGNVIAFSNASGSVGLFVSSTSNVGIGTTNPATALDVYTGTMNAATVAASTQFSGPGTGLTGTAASLNVGGTSGGLSGTPNITVGTVSGTTLTASSAFNASGTATYQVAGTTVIDASRNLTNIASGTLSATPAAAANVLTVIGSSTTGNVVQFSNSAGGNFVMTSAGRVGIGTTSPGYLLHVNTTGTTGTNIASFFAPSLASGGQSLNVLVGSTQTINQCGVITWLNYGTNSTNVMQLSMYGVSGSSVNITSTGVGIGVTNPGVTLEVNGIATFANPWWIITGSGGNATYTAGQVWGSSAVNASFYGSSVFTGGGASAGQWNGATGVFTFPQKGVYSITICMFINGTTSGRWSVMSIASSVSGSSNQYMEFDPTNYAGNNQRNFKIVRYFNANDTFNCYTEGGAITLYWALIHTVYFINKIG